jgi:hypothetical protein
VSSSILNWFLLLIRKLEKKNINNFFTLIYIGTVGTGHFYSAASRRICLFLQPFGGASFLHIFFIFNDQGKISALLV